MELVVLRGEAPAWAPSTGDGSGDGSGSGSGYGDGYGSGYGSGDGSGYGSGDGSGSGSGYGDGYGSGYGDGYGYGYGDGYGSYWLACIKYFSKLWSDAQRDRLEQLKALGAKIAFWSSTKDGKPCHGGKSHHTAAPGVVETVNGPLGLCTNRALHATELPPKWKGDRLWVVALIGEVAQDDDKFGALQREIIGEVPKPGEV